MLDSLIRWSLENRAIVLTLAVAVLGLGGYAVTQLPVDVLPDITAPTVTLLAEHPGMAPTDMERLVTFPIETVLNGIPDVRRVRSATAVGAAVIWVEFDWGRDLYRARQMVTERMALVSGSLPPGTSAPTLGPTSSIMGEILFIALTSDRHDGVDLRTVADTQIRRRILSIPGVAQATPLGGGQKQYQVLVAPDLLQDYGVSLSEARAALAGASANTSAGFLTHGGREYLVRGIARFEDLESVRQTVVRASGTTPVLVRDIGRVAAGESLRRGDGSYSGEPAVVIGIRKQPEANTLTLTARIDQVLDELAGSLPEGMRIHRRVFRQSEFIETAINNLEEALSYGGLLVVVVLALFLANARASAIALCAIPLSLCVTFLGFRLFDLTINSMTLGGLAIAIGELVDDALIDVENVFRRSRLNLMAPRDRRRPRFQVVHLASREIRLSIAFATLIVILVFVPVLMLESVEGIVLRPLAFAYVTALLASLLVALTVTPVLCFYLFPRTPAKKMADDSALIRLLKKRYRPVVHWTLNHWALVAALSLVLLAAAVGGFARMGRSFLPAFNEGSLTVSAVTLPGTSLVESARLGAALERTLLQVPEVASTGRRTGRAELDEHLQGVESAEIDVLLEMKDRPKEEVLADIRRRATLIPGTNVNVGQPISHRIDHLLSGTRSSVAVKIFGDDLRTLRSLAADVEGAMREVEGVVDLASEQQADIPTVTARFSRDALSHYAMPAGAAAEALETVFLGTRVGTVPEGQVPVPLVLRYDGGMPTDLETVRRTMIDTPSGARVPLSAIAEIREERSPNVVTREGVRRKIVVSCNVAGGDLRGVVTRIQERVAEKVKLPPGYRIEYGGQFESQEQATRRILWAGSIVVVAIFVLLVTAFRSRTDALLVMCNLPLALVGGVAGVYLADGILSVASLIGFITLFGIATRNGIMLVSHFQHLALKEGVTDRREAVIRGASERLAPILMTALSTGIALLPVALALGETGSEIHAPLALVVLCGLFSSTVLNMLVVPAVYYRFGRFGQPGQSEGTLARDAA